MLYGDLTVKVCFDPKVDGSVQVAIGGDDAVVLSRTCRALGQVLPQSSFYHVGVANRFGKSSNLSLSLFLFLSLPPFLSLSFSSFLILFFSFFFVFFFITL